MLTGRKYRLRLTGDQVEMCEEYGSICRSVWNTGLEQRRQYRRRGSWMNYVPQASELADAKKEFEWLRAAPSHILQQLLKDLDKACREHGTFKVRWRSKARWSPSFRFPAGNFITVERLGRKWGRAKLPKLGWVTFRWSRPLDGEVRSATLSRKGAHWYVSFLVSTEETTPERHAIPNTAVGIDRGLVVAATTSDGDFHDRFFVTEGEKGRYRRLQHQLARTQKGSANRKKTVASLNRITGRITDRRGDFCCQVANQLTLKNSLVVLEDLKTCNMSKSASGTLAEPGVNVAQKRGLNRSILDKGWNRLELALQNAARYTGTVVVKVNPAYTSQRCSACGFVTERNRESQSVFVCKAAGCGHTAHADVNAAINIKAAGLAASACGDFAGRRSAKQEPVIRATGRKTRRRGIPVLQGGEEVKQPQPRSNASRTPRSAQSCRRQVAEPDIAARLDPSTEENR